MTTFQSCHLVVSRNIPDDHKHVHDFIDTDLSHGEVFLLYFWNGLNPQTLKTFLAIMLIWGKC